MHSPFHVSSDTLAKKDADNKANQIADAARASLSDYCSSECKAYCCRRGFLLLEKDQVPLFASSEKDSRVIATEKDGGGIAYAFDLAGAPDGCPKLRDHLCIIHKDPARPKACKDFPLFFWKEKTVMATRVCPAVKENKLYPFLAELKRLGYRIVYSDGKC